MILVLLITTVVFLSVYLVLKWRRVRNFWAAKGVPHYTPNPVVGSLTFLQRENPAIWMRRLYNDFDSPYVGMWAFWRPGLVVNSPELAKNILVRDHQVFRNRFSGSGKTDPTGALNLTFVKDPLWSFLRRRLSVIFTSAKLKNISNILVSKSSALVTKINQEVTKHNLFDSTEILTDYTTDVIGEAAFGIACNTTKAGDSVIRKVTRGFMKSNLYRGVSWSSIFFFPELVDYLRLSLFPKESMKILRDVFRIIVEQRGGYDKEVTETKDLLDALLKIRQDTPVDSEEMAEDLLLAQAGIFLLGGYETSAVAIAWSLYELAWNPKYQERLYQELLEAKQKHGDQELDASALTEITYLNCVIKEVLRKFPAMGWLDRIAATEYKVDDKLTIPAGTIVYVNVNGMHQDPKYFPEPEEFNPDRFLPENEKDIQPYTYMPFGEGPRACIGKRFGYQTVRQGISSILLKYELRPMPNTPCPNDFPFEKNKMFLCPGEKMYLKYIPRHKDI